MKKLQDFANESLNESKEDFDLIFDEFVNELESDDDKTKASNLKESFRKKFANHAKNVGNSAKGFIKSLWNDEHVGH